MAESANNACSHDALPSGKTGAHAQPETSPGLLERSRAAIQAIQHDLTPQIMLLRAAETVVESSLLQRSRDAGHILTQDDQPTQGKDGKSGQAQDQKQGQQETGEQKPEPPQEKENFYWRSRIGRGPQEGQSSGGNEGSSGNAGNEGNAGTNQDGYQRALGRSLPDEQKQNDPDRGRGR